MTSPLVNRTLSAAIIDRLRQEILRGDHRPRTQLKQDALAATYGVSRIPVREALLQLESEGLVRIEPHRGAVVTSLSRDEVEDIFALRLLLEPRLLRSSVPALTGEDLARLDRLHQAFDTAIEQGDAGRWGRLNAELHLAMYSRTNQPRSYAIVANLLQTSERYTRLQLATRQAWLRARREHADLVALCRAGDADRAAASLEAHIATVHADLSRLAELGVAGGADAGGAGVMRAAQPWPAGPARAASRALQPASQLRRRPPAGPPDMHVRTFHGDER